MPTDRPETTTSIDPRAQGLFDRATAEPAAVLAEGWEIVDEISDSDSKSVAYRAMSIAARTAGTVKESVAYARIACDLAGDSRLGMEAQGTLAGSLATGGDIPRALEVLEAASKKAFGITAAKLEFQRGAIFTVAGDYPAALEAYDRAFPKFRSAEDHEFMALVLRNQGFIYIHMGRLEEAESALTRARVIDETAGRLVDVAGIDHNLGLLASYRGDIPEALHRLTSSDELQMKQTGETVPRHVSRCEVLLTAGLYREALVLASAIAAGAREKGRAEDEADALLVAARSALLAGDPAQATTLATAARDRFTQQGREVWATHASLSLAEARYEDEGASPGLLDLIGGVADQLEESGFPISAARASILAGRIAIDLGDVATAERSLEWLSALRSGPVELSIQRWHATALLRLRGGDTRGADAAARAGLDLLDGYQSALGASDLRSGIERHGVELGEIGLALAVDAGKPRRVFGWMERTRARSLRFRPVLPHPDDPEQPLLEELRKVTSELREHPDEAALLQRRRHLQDELSRHNRTRSSSESGDSGFGIEPLLESLGDATLVEMGAVDGQLLCVVVRAGKFSIHTLGDLAPVVSELGHLRFDLRRAARLRRNTASIRRAVEDFDNMVFNGLEVEGERVILSPPGTLMAAPWAVLPSLVGRTVVVAPSAELWWRAQARSPQGSGVLLAAGPDLSNAEVEVAKLATIYPGADVLGPADPASRFGESASGAEVAHAACHARFELDNPMFSALRFGDGDFNVYDFERLRNPPDLVVLSACDSGYTDTREGDELAGITSALLSMGSHSVVASVGLVPDTTATTDLMLRFHRARTSGLGPGAALARAQADALDDHDGFIAAASFLCIGGG